eukprot:gnl/MRDRNA2_/MRDRNA2_64303_c0_seq1.p1 gnl/MRDRNA2_/MRDRNA2_64303_c0~~gnl/MRDRNA2_/MRDRNA2_64303_c0_seq1.p1  ORF type:complete len:167 (+),score=32.39 gnl/MRDRNA2_/MRDRNA2_64303_c0_seq1:488-988(+)
MGIESERIVVGGLSQGGALALASALTYPQRLGGAACLGGWLPRCVPASKASDGHSSLCPVLWSHGKKDEVVLPELQETGVARLRASDVEVTCLCDPDGGHFPGAKQLAELQDWMDHVLVGEGTPIQAQRSCNNKVSQKASKHQSREELQHLKGHDFLKQVCVPRQK